jgi:hypothetical protein
MATLDLDKHLTKYTELNPPDNDTQENVLERLTYLRGLEAKVASVRERSKNYNREFFGLSEKTLKKARVSLSVLTEETHKELGLIHRWVIRNNLMDITFSPSPIVQKVAPVNPTLEALKSLLLVTERLRKMRGVTLSGLSKLTLDEIEVIKRAHQIVENT